MESSSRFRRSYFSGGVRALVSPTVLELPPRTEVSNVYRIL
jgi:hypothetical protein